MAYIPIEKLLRGTLNIYKLVMAVAKRATQLSEGAQPLIETSSKKITTIALEEIAEGKVHFEDDVPPAKESAKASEKQES